MLSKPTPTLATTLSCAPTASRRASSTGVATVVRRASAPATKASRSGGDCGRPSGHTTTSCSAVTGARASAGIQDVETTRAMGAFSPGAPAAQVRRLTTLSGRCRMAVPIGTQGQAGTRALTAFFSMAPTMARTPVSVSTMNGIGFLTLSFISERM